VNYCVKCRAPAGGIVVLCNDCTIGLRIELVDVPSLVRDLEITYSRQDQLGKPYGNGPGSGENPLPFKTHIPEVAWILHHTLASWAHDFNPAHFARPVPTADVARWLVANLARIRVHAHAGQLVDEITTAIHAARHAIDRPDDRRQFLGPCATELSPGLYCRYEVYGVPWNTHATCPQCGTRHDIAARQAWLHDIAQDHLGTAVEIAGFLQTTGMKCTYETIRGYVRRGRLAPVPDTIPPLYRIRDVLTALGNRYQHQSKAPVTELREPNPPDTVRQDPKSLPESMPVSVPSTGHRLLG
jgi:hypothetical protein